ncbi:MAG: hypothetical protein OHK0045_22780 [Raineya sp.]
MPISVQPQYNLVQGEDLLADLLVITNNNAPNLNDCLDIYVSVRSGNHASVIEFALNPTDSISNQLEIDSEQSNVLKLPLKRSDTKALQPGTLFCDLILKFDDADFPEGRHDEISNIKIGTIREGKLKDVVI